MAAAATLESVEEAPPKRKSPIVLIGVAVAACGAGGAGVYFLAPENAFPSTSGAAESVAQDVSHEEHATHGSNEKTDKKKKADGQGAVTASGVGDNGVPSRFMVAGDRGLYMPEGLVVSIRPSGAVRHLKLSIAVETSGESGQYFLERELRIRDALNTYLRAVDVSALEDPAGMDRIRAQIARRIEFVVAPAPVNAVLITDFILS